MSDRTVAVLQSNYIPWKGYFDIVNMADLFVFYDDIQFTKEDWRSRNRIKTQAGPKWLTVPCGSKLNRLICEVQLQDHRWQRKHWSMVRHNYAKAPHFKDYREFFEEFYLGRNWKTLAELNQSLITRVSRELLGSTTEFADSRDYDLGREKSRDERWLELLHRVGTRNFVLGPSARNYLDEARQAEIESGGIRLVWMDYSNYPEYHQLFPPFEHHVSIVDLILNEGPNAGKFMKSFGHTVSYGG